MTQLSLGQKIASQRKLAGFSQEELAEKLDISRQAVSKWESDATIPEIDKLIALSKLYDVSIGWLLGVESEPNAQAGFSEDQLQTIEELLLQHHKQPRTAWWKYAVVGVGLLAIVLAFLHNGMQLRYLEENNQKSASQIYELIEENDSLQELLEAVSADNKALKSQLDSINELMLQQEARDRLLTDFFRLEAHADENLENITAVLYMRPKVYDPDKTALLSIQNAKTGFSKTVDCSWNPYNQVYIASFTVPAEDGHKFTFILQNGTQFEEENLLIRDSGFGRFGMLTQFHIDPDHSGAVVDSILYTDGQSPVEYSFNAPIHSPHIFAKTAVAYKDIRIILRQNGKIVWEQSYLQAFYTAAGGTFLNAAEIPVYPDIRIPLTMANFGDRFELSLEAETANGGGLTQKYDTLLDSFYVQDIRNNTAP